MSTKTVKAFKKIIPVVGLLIAGGAVGYGLGALIKGTVTKEVIVGAGVPFYAVLGILFLSFFIVILVHELGHVLGGLIGGSEFYLLVVGPLKLEKEEGRIRFAFNSNLSLFGGLAMTIPTNHEKFKSRRALTVAAGPGASLLLTLLCALPVFFTSPETLPAVLRFSLFSLSVLSLFIFMATIIPMQMGGFMSDGMQLLRVFQHNPTARRYESLLQLITLIQQGLRPKDFSEEQIQTISSLGYDDVFGVSALNYQYYRALDREEWSQAQHWLDLLEEKIEVFPSAFQNDLWAEVAVFYSFLSPHPDKANALMDKLGKHLKHKKDSISTLIINLGMAALAGEEAMAEDYAKKILASQKKDGISLMYKAIVQQKMATNYHGVSI